MRKLFLLVLAAALVAAACGDDDSTDTTAVAEQQTTTATSTPATSAATGCTERQFSDERPALEDETAEATLYFYADRGLLSVFRMVGGGKTPQEKVERRLIELLNGVDELEASSTPQIATEPSLAETGLLGVCEQDGVVQVNLETQVEPAARAQIVFTATTWIDADVQFAFDAVEFQLGGEATNTETRADHLGALPPVFIEFPAWGSHSFLRENSPELIVSGIARDDVGDLAFLVTDLEGNALEATRTDSDIASSVSTEAGLSAFAVALELIDRATPEPFVWVFATGSALEDVSAWSGLRAAYRPHVDACLLQPKETPGDARPVKVREKGAGDGGLTERGLLPCP